MKGMEISEIEGIIKLIDERAEDLTMTWSNEKKKLTPEIKARLFELSWIRESLQELIANAKLSQSK